MTVLEVIQRSTAFLEAKGVDSPRLQGELLLAQVLRVPRLNLYLQFDRVLDAGQVEAARELVRRRGRREPLQHLLGTAAFCGLEFKAGPAALIPRPETEGLVEQAVPWLQARREADLLDFGTGTGCLAITLAVRLPSLRCVALDVSTAALDLARENAARHGVEARVRFVESDGFSALEPGARFDLIVANPPYIPTAEIATLQPEVREHDPRLALDGGPDGQRFYRLLAAEAAAWLRPGGGLIAELGDGQAPAVRQLFEAHNWVVERVEADYSARPRLLLAHPAIAAS